MNTIRTVADLQRVLAVYPQHLPIEVQVLDGITVKPASINNDTQVCHVKRLGPDGMGADARDTVQISVVLTGASRFAVAPLHDPSNNDCPRNADPRNESCACGRSVR